MDVKLKEYAEKYPLAMASEEVCQYIEKYYNKGHIGEMSGGAFDATMTILLSNIEEKKRLETLNEGMYMAIWNYMYTLSDATLVDVPLKRCEERDKLLKEIRDIVTKMTDDEVSMLSREYSDKDRSDIDALVDLQLDTYILADSYTAAFSKLFGRDLNYPKPIGLIRRIEERKKERERGKLKDE